MKRRNRELNIFSMSALDLFASAMGAFVLITLVLLPYYLKVAPTSPDPSQQCPELVPAPSCPICPAPTPVPSCPVSPPTVVKEIVDNLLVMQMMWNESKADVDLYVQTPDGEFHYNNKTIRGKPGKITLDNRKGGSNSLEIWMAYNPTPGDYHVYFKFCCGGRGAPVNVSGLLDKPRGPVLIPRFSLRKGLKQKVLSFTITPQYEYVETFRLGS